MSHYHERTEKDCLNCGTIVEGRYCQHCGQENIVPKETFWGLLTHFVYDITHFDGKFFSTLKYLIGKPGFLSLEFMRGRRASYLHPIRMYVFTSAFFFVIFFTMYSAKDMIKNERERLDERKTQLVSAKKNLEEHGITSTDSIERVTSVKVLADISKELSDVERQLAEKEKARETEKVTDSADLVRANAIRDSLIAEGIPLPKGMIRITPSEKGGISYTYDSTLSDPDIPDFKYRSALAYKRMQEALPADRKDGWLKRSFLMKLAVMVEEGESKGEREYLRKFLDALLHSFPQMLFVSLPIFALILKLLYMRRRHLYYADHSIFTIHVYCATFIFMLAWFGLSRLEGATDLGILKVVLLVSMVFPYFYLYKAMRTFYGQGRGKTIAKFLLLNFLSFVMMVTLLSVFTAISAAKLAEGH